MAKADQNFMNDAVQGDLSEIKMGKLAQQKGQSQGVKQFGQMLEQDHSQIYKRPNRPRSSWDCPPPPRCTII